MEVVYKIDGIDFKDYGVYVSSSQGLIGGLKPKKRFEADWADEHGSQVDATALFFESRSIVLNCFMAADNASQFADRMVAFSSLFYRPEDLLLSVSFADKTIEYRVVLSDAIHIEKRFQEGKMVALFALKLCEYAPVIPGEIAGSLAK